VIFQRLFLRVPAREQINASLSIRGSHALQGSAEVTGSTPARLIPSVQSTWQLPPESPPGDESESQVG